MKAVKQFRDLQDTINDFTNEYLVVCPNCSACACVVLRDPEKSGIFAPRRLICRKCGHTNDWEGNQLNVGFEYESYFGLPLWLRTNVGNHALWAYNQRHLKLIEDFVRASLRERRRNEQTGWRNNSVISRLPDWIKDGKRRKQILKAIERMKQRFEACDNR